MRILLLSPGKFSFYKKPSESLTSIFIYPRLGLRILATLTPSTYHVTVLEEDKCNYLNFKEEADLVGISVLTPHADKCYRIADNYRERGTKVVLGGVHSSLLPNEAKEHADAVVIGRAENIWKDLLKDFERGKLKSFYQDESPPEFMEVIAPKRFLSDHRDYSNCYPVQSGFGCSAGCAFCTVPIFWGTKFIPRPITSIIKEIKSIKKMTIDSPVIIFNENLLSHPEYCKKLARKLQSLGVSWSAEGELTHLQDRKYLHLLKKSGIGRIYVETKMHSSKKSPKMIKIFGDAVEKIKDEGIHIYINFTIGYDDHDESIFQEILDFVRKYTLRYSWAVQVLVPWPNLPYFKKLEREKRVITRDWTKYNNKEAVFIPKFMSPEKLQEGYLWIWKNIEPPVDQGHSRRYEKRDLPSHIKNI
jgi:radical SAM superfamily enzyme YgiQ (UPF0313 family)